MRSILAVAIFYVLFISGVQSQATVYFNATTNCTSGCSITDPTIYEGGILPTIDSIVVFNVTEQHCWFHLNSNETYQVNSLTIYGVVGLNLKSNSSLQVIELYLYQVWIHVSNNASLLVHDTAELADNSTVINNGTIFVVSFSSSLSDLLADGSSSFFVEEEFEFENGTILFSQNSNFSSHETEFTDSIMVFYNRPYLGDVEFERVDAQFPNGFIVEDHYVITNSNFTAYFPDELSNVSLILGGQNNLTVSNLIFASNKIKINNTGSPFITFNVNQNAVFNGSLDVPGEIVVNTGSNIVFNGSINISGGLKVEVDNDTQIQTLGSLTCGNPISLKGHSGLNFLRVNSAVITAPAIILEQFVLTTDGTSQLVGNVINNGAIHIFDESSLFIQGNYSQETDAILGVYNIVNNDNHVVNLFINGTAYLDGELKFNATETKIKFTAVILEATSIDGKFAKESYDLDDIELFSSRVDYEQNHVSVTITPDKTKHFLGLHWWAWLLIIGGGVILTISIIAFIISRRRAASSYQPIRR